MNKPFFILSHWVLNISFLSNQMKENVLLKLEQNYHFEMSMESEIVFLWQNWLTSRTILYGNNLMKKISGFRNRFFESRNLLRHIFLWIHFVLVNFINDKKISLRWVVYGSNSFNAKQVVSINEIWLCVLPGSKQTAMRRRIICLH